MTSAEAKTKAAALTLTGDVGVEYRARFIGRDMAKRDLWVVEEIRAYEHGVGKYAFPVAA